MKRKRLKEKECPITKQTKQNENWDLGQAKKKHAESLAGGLEYWQVRKRNEKKTNKPPPKKKITKKKEEMF